MVQSIRTRAEFERLLANHPAVRKLPRVRARRPNPGLLRAGAPQLLLDHADADTAACALALKRVMEHHRRVTLLRRRLVKGGKVSLASELALVRSGRNIEEDFRGMLRSACKAARRNPRLGAVVEAMASRPADAHVFANPAFLSPTELAAVRFTGVRPDQLSDYFGYFSLPHHKMATFIMKHGTLDKLLAFAEKQAPRLRFPESPRQLAASGILTLGGSDEAINWIEEAASNVADNLHAIAEDFSELVTTYVVPVATIAVGAVIFPFAPTVGADLILVGAGAFAYELMQDHSQPGSAPAPAPATGSGSGPADSGPAGPSPPRTGRDMSFSEWFIMSQVQSAIAAAKTYGYALGNMSRTKREIHTPSCSYLHLVKPEHLQTFDDIKAGKAAGLDNCYYCIGDSTR